MGSGNFSHDFKRDAVAQITEWGSDVVRRTKASGAGSRLPSTADATTFVTSKQWVVSTLQEVEIGFRLTWHVDRSHARDRRLGHTEACVNDGFYEAKVAY